MDATLAPPSSDFRLTRAELRSRWHEMLHNRLLSDIPGKLELSDRGAIELTPANLRHGLLQAFIAAELRRLRPDGATFIECGIETDIGVRVPDVAWASAEFMRQNELGDAFPSAPELCVEVLSPSNTRFEMQQKRTAYLAAGAVEVWLVSPDAAVEMFDRRGRIETSGLGIVLGQMP